MVHPPPSRSIISPPGRDPGVRSLRARHAQVRLDDRPPPRGDRDGLGRGEVEPGREGGAPDRHLGVLAEELDLHAARGREGGG